MSDKERERVPIIINRTVLPVASRRLGIDAASWPRHADNADVMLTRFSAARKRLELSGCHHFPSHRWFHHDKNGAIAIGRRPMVDGRI